MIGLFLSSLQATSLYFAAYIRDFCFVGWLSRRRTNRTFRGIILRGLLIGAAISVLIAAVVTWWIIGHVPAPD
jgi:hypothetical protein